MKSDGLCDMYCERIMAQSWIGGWCSHPENQKWLEESLVLGGHFPESDQMLNGISHDCYTLLICSSWTIIPVFSLEPQNCTFHLQDYRVQCSIHKEWAPSRRLLRAYKYCSGEKICFNSHWKCGKLCYRNCFFSTFFELSGRRFRMES